ncbi:metal ABC transporter substrate-binding protein [endosymbiont 'TC1' of Trimyema compressum]|uniref:metal ABC transporter substrate-binding protein n=1 Tax=endosymbiont 'TC1' of Trimyema compressum TaxID=243899 RepID=UPI00248094E5|nr:metal ABC transporter substrate-binding protein [endosymbiont 'TC1' of Trimyema compressum]
MKKIIIVLSVILLGMTLFGCTEKPNKNNEKTTIVTTLYPQYDFAKEIAGDKAEVLLLIPPGVETHSFEPSPKDIITINESDLFIYTGEKTEVWAAKIIENIPKETVVVDVSKGINLTKNENHEDHDHDHEDAHHHEYDPHIWTNPVFVKTMVHNIVDGLVEKDSENTDYYRQNGDKYIEKLDALDQGV